MVLNLFSMQDKVCVITGGHSGLGKAMATAFLQAGAKRVYINGRSKDACEKTAQELSEFGNCIALPADVSSAEGIVNLTETLKSNEDSIEVLVNNAGTGWIAPFEKYPEDGWSKVMDLNAKTPFFLSQKLLPLLAAQATAKSTTSIINIGSIAAVRGDASSMFSYSASKAAVHQVTRNMAHNLANKHIRVNAIAPGRFHSNMTKSIQENEKQYKAEINAIPLHRWGNDQDIAGIALLLASQAGAFVTGEIIHVDGGTTLL